MRSPGFASAGRRTCSTSRPTKADLAALLKLLRTGAGNHCRHRLQPAGPRRWYSRLVIRLSAKGFGQIQVRPGNRMREESARTKSSPNKRASRRRRWRLLGGFHFTTASPVASAAPLRHEWPAPMVRTRERVVG